MTIYLVITLSVSLSDGTGHWFGVHVMKCWVTCAKVAIATFNLDFSSFVRGFCTGCC